MSVYDRFFDYKNNCFHSHGKILIGKIVIDDTFFG